MNQSSMDENKQQEKRSIELAQQKTPTGPSVRSREFWFEHIWSISVVKNFLTKNIVGKFDGLAVVLVIAASALVVFSYDSGGNFLAVSTACFSAIFTVLAIRETKRNREARHAPTLFLAIRNGKELGLKNIGNGPAHELTVEDREISDESLVENAIVEADGFISLEPEDAEDRILERAEPIQVKMSYGDCLGVEHTNIVREANLSDWQSS
ncbi:hypothetical protein [Halorussus halophilus]|uniref:hypothetical protein n=1 Tax=Halorussus halophilus TaxID=2650975 RepID=UPI001300E57A|nr:hypothetical protein [Halorussus halophilus]